MRTKLILCLSFSITLIAHSNAMQQPEKLDEIHQKICNDAYDGNFPDLKKLLNFEQSQTVLDKDVVNFILSLAAWYGRTDIIDPLLAHTNFVENIHKEGACSALCHAVRNLHIDVVQMLMNNEMIFGFLSSDQVENLCQLINSPIHRQCSETREKNILEIKNLLEQHITSKKITNKDTIKTSSQKLYIDPTSLRLVLPENCIIS